MLGPEVGNPVAIEVSLVHSLKRTLTYWSLRGAYFPRSPSLVLSFSFQDLKTSHKSWNDLNRRLFLV